MKVSLRGLLLGLATLAMVTATLAMLTLELRHRIDAARAHVAAQTRLLTTAGAPLLLNALVVGDLATAEQTLRSINSDPLWRSAKLYEPDGKRVILDVSAPHPPKSDAPSWMGRLLPIELHEERIPIAAAPVTYAILAVTPSSERLEHELWREVRTTVLLTVLPLAALLVLMHLILAHGLGPVRALGESAARLGAGNLSVRIPPTRLTEIAPAVDAFNSMAASLERLVAELGRKEAALEQREAERRRAERRRAAQFAVSRILAETAEAEEALRRLLGAIGDSLGWPSGALWRLDAEAEVLRLACRWVAAPGGAAAPEIEPAPELARGDGLPGRVWLTGQPAWSHEVLADLGRGAAVPVAPPRGALAFPIRGARGVVGVMTLERHESQPPDQELLAALADIGGQIGQFLDRKDGEEALRRAEEQLRQAQKMEAIGQLAGGVAHDFNNLLTIILGRAELVLAQLGEGHRVHGALTMIHSTAERAAALTRQLLAFGRKQVLQPRSLDLNEVVEGLAPMLRRLIGEHIDLEVRLTPGVGRVEADPSRLEQVIVNLAVNARDAMPNGGRLTIDTAEVELDAAYVRRHQGARAGCHVRLAVSDTGVGMDARTKARVFEPFFTTKEVGKGTGLGLSTVYGIVKQSGGSIWAYSEVGHGTAFKVYLPVAAAAPAGEAAEGGEGVVGGVETILLAEDEEGVRTLAHDVLRARGYTVLAAEGPAAAARLCAAHAGRIDLLLTDVVMPESSGRDLAERLQPLRPAMKVLFMSGYTDQAIVHHGVLDPGVAYLEKPFTADTLARKVREILDTSPQPVVVGNA